MDCLSFGLLTLPPNRIWSKRPKTEAHRHVVIPSPTPAILIRAISLRAYRVRSMHSRADVWHGKPQIRNSEIPEGAPGGLCTRSRVRSGLTKQFLVGTTELSFQDGLVGWRHK